MRNLVVLSVWKLGAPKKINFGIDLRQINSSVIDEPQLWQMIFVHGRRFIRLLGYLVSQIKKFEAPVGLLNTFYMLNTKFGICMERPLTKFQYSEYVVLFLDPKLTN
jgi:hypothetical protein